MAETVHETSLFHLSCGPLMKFEVCILAGGLSTRFGRDKARLRFGRRTMLSIIRHAALELRIPVRVIRRDRVPRCGPLGGILTALQTTRAGAVLFLACDMPLITPALLRKLLRASRNGSRAAFASADSRPGFPLLLPRATLPTVESQIAQRSLSIHGLAGTLVPCPIRVRASKTQLLNVNTPEDAEAAAGLLDDRFGKG
jgi:molybdenum cofactor guanylyltransferase